MLKCAFVVGKGKQSALPVRVRVQSMAYPNYSPLVLYIFYYADTMSPLPLLAQSQSCPMVSKSDRGFLCNFSFACMPSPWH